MTLRTIGSPFDPQTLTEIKAEIARYKGIGTFSDFASAQQTAYQRVIDSAPEYLSKRFGHEPWMIHEESLSLASGTATLTLSAACRHVITITDTYNGTTRVATITTKRDYMLAWGSGTDTHPWSTQNDPKWYFDGMSSDNPPKQQWKRVPTPDMAVTGTALVRPYLTLIETGGDSDKEYSHIPANAATAMMDYILARCDKSDRDWEGASQNKQWMEDEIQALTINDNPEEGSETPVFIDLPSRFLREWNAE